MKKTTAFLLALLLLLGCLSTLAGCGKRYTPSDLSAYLDKEGFVPGMSQSAFREKVEKIEDEKVDGLHWDGEYGGGWDAYSTNCSYANGYVAKMEEGVAVYSNTVSASAKPKGLKMPAGIRFSDTLADVLKKLSITGDPVNEFTPDPGKTDVMTLYAEGNVTLKLTDRRLTPTETEETKPGTVVCSWDVPNPLVLEFSEVTSRPLDYDRTETVTRTVGFAFADESSALGNFYIGVTERTPLMQRYAKEAHAIFCAFFASDYDFFDGYAVKKAGSDDFYDAQAEEPEMPDQAQVTVYDRIYTGTLRRTQTGAGEYRLYNTYPVFSYRFDGGTFEVDPEGRLTRFITDAPSGNSRYAYSSEYCQGVAEQFFRYNLSYVDIDDYTVSVSDPFYGNSGYAVTFTRTVGNVETTDQATILVVGNGENLTFTSMMLGRIRLTENPFDLESVKAAIAKKFRAAVGDMESLFVSVDCGIEKKVLTQLYDGTPALLVTITPRLTEIRRDGEEYTHVQTETVLVRIAEE